MFVWWRNEFVLPATFAKKHIAIHFPCINYRANLWFNGQKIADAQEVAGTYPIFEFDLTKYPARRENVIALEITAPAKDGSGHHVGGLESTPADKDLASGRSLGYRSGAVAIRNPFVKDSFE